jgi:hypothetical protein
MVGECNKSPLRILDAPYTAAVRIKFVRWRLPPLFWETRFCGHMKNRARTRKEDWKKVKDGDREKENYSEREREQSEWEREKVNKRKRTIKRELFREREKKLERIVNGREKTNYWKRII